MKVNVRLPSALRQYAGGQQSVSLEGNTVGEILKALTDRHAPLKRHLLDEKGSLRSFVSIFLNDESIHQLQGEETAVNEGDTVLIVPAIAGGKPAAGVPAAGVPAVAGARTAEARTGNGSTGKATERKETELSRKEMQRYSRHLLMPEVALSGQRKLKEARVLVVGTGGLGAPLGLYLTAAGVGKLGLVDFDTVDMSNLQRQVLFTSDQVGKPKVKAARERLKRLNPDIEIQTYETRLTSENALDIIRDYDLVIDGTDNFPTRYLVNDACVLLGKANVYGSIFRFEGQVSVFWAERGPCYRCLYPTPPPPGLIPSCAEGGVLGVLPGVVGSLQATEAIKLILDVGEPLLGRLMLFDALSMEWRTVKLHKNPECPVCGEHPSVTELIDYEEFCGIRGVDMEVQTDREITVKELKRKLDDGEDVVILDVRESHEYEISRLPGSRIIPLGELDERMSELSTADDLVVHCRSGSRSARAVRLLRKNGFQKAVNLKGGILAWSDEVDSSVVKY